MSHLKQWEGSAEDGAGWRFNRHRDSLDITDEELSNSIVSWELEPRIVLFNLCPLKVPLFLVLALRCVLEQNANHMVMPREKPVITLQNYINKVSSEFVVYIFLLIYLFININIHSYFKLNSSE